MKKLMVMMGVAISAIALNAATVTWQSGTLYLPDEDGAKTTDKAQSGDVGKNAPITAYLFSIDKATYDSLFVYDAVQTSVVDVDATIAKIVDTYKGKEATATGNSKTSNLGALSVADTKNYSVYETAYAAILFETEVNGEKQYLGNLAENYFASADDVKPGNMGVKFQGTGANIESKWTAVPEPTSGLLLLLGVAGLALRRRRA